MRKLVLALLTVGLVALTAPSALAVPQLLHFDNIDLDLGLNSQVNLADQYSALYGVSFHEVYRYIDVRDPFVDPGALAGNPPLNFGISNGFIAQNEATATNGTMFFDRGNTSYFNFDWWTIGDNSMTVEAYDEWGVLQDNFFYDGLIENGSGSVAMTGDIAYVEFHNHGGFVNMANIGYDAPAAVPEPGTLALFGFGLTSGAAFLRRRRATKK
jgi:hypothetical protein